MRFPLRHLVLRSTLVFGGVLFGLHGCGLTRVAAQSLGASPLSSSDGQSVIRDRRGDRLGTIDRELGGSYAIRDRRGTTVGRIDRPREEPRADEWWRLRR